MKDSKASKPFVCPDCGKTYMLPSAGGRKRCPDCAAAAFRRQVNEYQRRRRQARREGKDISEIPRKSVQAPKKEKPVREKKAKAPVLPRNNMEAIAEISVMGRKRNLSYGQMVVEMEKSQ